MDDNVYLGVWTNWSRGSIFGSTLTMQREHGNLLIAFTASFIGFVAARFWKILCLGFHRFWSTPKPQHTLYHQRQIILRNSSAPEASLLSLARLLWAWRRLPVQRLALVAFLALAALASLSGFTVAGGFSSSISTAAGNEVLLNGNNCGIVAPLVNLSEATVQDAEADIRRASVQVNDALNYAQQCYGETNELGDADCNRFVVGNLTTATTNDRAGCPFQDSICRATGSNLELDTGYLDSNDDLGLNAPEDQRFAMRYVMHCAPLKTEGYTSREVASNRTWVRYHYGEVESGSLDNVTILDYTYQVQDIDSQYISEGQGAWLEGKYFILSAKAASTLNGKPYGGSYNPIPELQVPDGDLSVVFLSGNGVGFIQPMDDGWYQVTTPWRTIRSTGGSGSTQSYRPNEAALPMGCVEKWQWCNSAYPRETGCGPLASGYDAMFGAAPLFNLTVKDFDPSRPVSPTEPGNRLVWPAIMFWGYPSTLPSILRHLGARALESQTRLSDGLQWPLPNNQWHLDVKHWFSTILASIQASFVDTALGNTNPEFDKYVLHPLTDVERTLCSSQKIHSSAYTSFSMFGLCFTFAMGTLIIAISFALEPFLSFLYKWKKYKPYAHLEWNTNTNLQLHRFAHEELGLVEWRHCTREVPTTDPEAYLACLDIADPKHPVLSHRADANTTEGKPEQSAVSSSENSNLKNHVTVETVQDDIPTYQPPEMDHMTKPETPLSPTDESLTIGRASTGNSERYDRPVSAISSMAESQSDPQRNLGVAV
ncbi:hypothetical protein Hte_000191 [Hypoxylon texense]